MNHLTLPIFWRHYNALPKEVQKLADQQFERLRADPKHPSLHFKKVGKRKQLWSARVGIHWRALGFDKPEGVVWIWIGPHGEYDKLLSQN